MKASVKVLVVSFLLLVVQAVSAVPIVQTYGAFDVTFHNNGDSDGLYTGQMIRSVSDLEWAMMDDMGWSLVPEPSTVSLLGLGGLFLRKKDSSPFITKIIFGFETFLFWLGAVSLGRGFFSAHSHLVGYL